jgi:hypothetical protein
MATPMCFHQEKTVSPLPKQIAQAIDAYADKFLDQLRRNEVPTNLDELNYQARAYVEYIAEQELAAQKRVRKSGPWCWFCGCEDPLVQCNCLFPDSLRCADHKICKDCSRAHVKIANHIRDILKYPRSNRVSSRRYQGWKQLREAAETIEELLSPRDLWTWLTLWRRLSSPTKTMRGNAPPRNCVKPCSKVSGKQLERAVGISLI